LRHHLLADDEHSESALLLCIWTAEGWLYVSAVIDLFSRRVVGWSISAFITTQSIADAPLMAI
jgi:transposase InsO family protein